MERSVWGYFRLTATLRPDDQVWVAVSYAHFNGRNLDYYHELFLFDAQGGLKLTRSGGPFYLNGMQSDGRILTLGASFTRLDADGSTDPAFYPNGPHEVGIDRIYSIQGGLTGTHRVQPDDKILLFGINNSLNLLKIARLNADGTVDPTLPVTVISPAHELLGIDPAGMGQVVVAAPLDPYGCRADVYTVSGSFLGSIPAGSAVCNRSLDALPIVAEPGGGFVIRDGPNLRRVTHTYELDSTFGQSGTVTLPPKLPLINYFSNIAVLPDRSVVGAISAVNSGGSPVYEAVGKWNADGTPDSAFGAQGYFLFNQPATTSFSKVLPLSTGKFLLVGTDTAQGTVVLTRIAPFTVQGKLFLSTVSK
jgi:uncharacterized delta-60 repeat protein